MKRNRQKCSYCGDAHHVSKCQLKPQADQELRRGIASRYLAGRADVLAKAIERWSKTFETTPYEARRELLRYVKENRGKL